MNEIVPKLKLTFPTSHLPAELLPLYREFRDQDPGRFAQWVEQERWMKEAKPEDQGPEHLLQICMQVEGFLKNRVEYTGQAALSGAFGDFRSLLFNEVFGYQIPERPRWR